MYHGTLHLGYLHMYMHNVYAYDYMSCTLFIGYYALLLIANGAQHSLPRTTRLSFLSADA